MLQMGGSFMDLLKILNKVQQVGSGCRHQFDGIHPSEHQELVHPVGLGALCVYLVPGGHLPPVPRTSAWFLEKTKLPGDLRPEWRRQGRVSTSADGVRKEENGRTLESLEERRTPGCKTATEKPLSWGL